MMIKVNSIFMSLISPLFLSLDFYPLRAISFGINDLFTCLPFIVCFKVKSVSMIHSPLNISVIFSSVVLFFIVLEILEWFVPGKFDYFGQSHQLFHLMFILLGTVDIFLVQKDALTKL